MEKIEEELSNVKLIFKTLFKKIKENSVYETKEGVLIIIKNIIEEFNNSKIEIVIPLHICINNEIEFSTKQSAEKDEKNKVLKIYIGLNINDKFYYKSDMINSDESTIHEKVYNKLYKQLDNLDINKFLKKQALSFEVSDNDFVFTTDDVKYIIEDCLLKYDFTPLLNTYSYNIQTSKCIEKYIKLNHRKTEDSYDNMVFDIEEDDRFILKIDYVENEKINEISIRENYEEGYYNINYDKKIEGKFKTIVNFIKNTKSKYIKGSYFTDKVPMEKYCIDKGYINKWIFKYDKNRNNVYSYNFTLLRKNNKMFLI
jgi:hypothetical protein